MIYQISKSLNKHSLNQIYFISINELLYIGSTSTVAKESNKTFVIYDLNEHKVNMSPQLTGKIIFCFL